MEIIQIPSPSALPSSPVAEAASLPQPPRQAQHQRRKSVALKDAPIEPKMTVKGVTKPKQTKSRTGCVTCKAKRLKCDEIKPTCAQCTKRGVDCGGYKRELTWKSFSEGDFNAKGPGGPQAKPKRSIFFSSSNHLIHAEGISDSATQSQPLEISRVESPTHSDASLAEDGGCEGEGDAPMQDTFFNNAVPSPQYEQSGPSFTDPFFQNNGFDMSTPPYLKAETRRRFEPDSVTSSLESLFEDTDLMPSGFDMDVMSLPNASMGMLMPGFIMPTQNSLPLFTQPFPFQSEMMSNVEDDIKEIMRQPFGMNNSAMALRTPSATRSASPNTERSDPFSRMFMEVQLPPGSQEMLSMRFDKQTCGILSVKDGPTENPWRTMIWPLAQSSPALYHAIASMTAFHGTRDRPSLRVDGVDHFRQSLRHLSAIATMEPEVALATTLVLAFAESWERHITTGIQHLKGASMLVSNALARRRRRPVEHATLGRIRFLCNAWVYMDVISRLTSIDDDVSTNFDHVMDPMLQDFGHNSLEVDPLMGCASTLFPLIGRVANLCRMVCTSATNSIAVINQATELKDKLEKWQAGSQFIDPEDTTSKIQDALQTAESYRYATLLYLHQAVPEIPSLTTAQLANKVLTKLATVPVSSRLVIVQIYPLLAAGCEATEDEERKWVKERWESMEQRMWIGNISKCWEVTAEVWKRRDEQKAKAQLEGMSCNSGLQQIRPPMALPPLLESSDHERTFEEEFSMLSSGFRPGNEVGGGEVGEMSMGEMFSYEELLNGTSNTRGREKQKKQRFSASAGAIRKKEVQILEDMDPEMTVRGRLHWAGVMQDYGWEVLLG